MMPTDFSFSLTIPGLYTTPVLHNRVSNEMLKARMLAETELRTTISFYKYFNGSTIRRRPAMRFIRRSPPERFRARLPCPQKASTRRLAYRKASQRLPRVFFIASTWR